MMVIGIDPHKCTHTATAVDPQHEPIRRLDPYRGHPGRLWPDVAVGAAVRAAAVGGGER